MTYAEAYARARPRAKYGQRDWLIWRDRAENGHAKVLTAATMKECLLATGTQGHWKVICARNGVGLNGFWWMGCNILRQCKRRGDETP